METGNIKFVDNFIKTFEPYTHSILTAQQKNAVLHLVDLLGQHMVYMAEGLILVNHVLLGWDNWGQELSMKIDTDGTISIRVLKKMSARHLSPTTLTQKWVSFEDGWPEAKRLLDEIYSIVHRDAPKANVSAVPAWYLQEAVAILLSMEKGAVGFETPPIKKLLTVLGVQE